MRARLRVLALTAGLAAAAVLAASCQHVDLSKTLSVTPILSGYYDAGLLDGWAHLLPTLTFKLKNTGTQDVPAGIQVTVGFWFAGDTDGENDSIVLPPLEKTLAPGEESGTITAQAPHGFRLEGARQDLFTNSRFKDMLAKVFAARHGTIYPLGAFPIDHQIIPHATTPGRP